MNYIDEKWAEFRERNLGVLQADEERRLRSIFIAGAVLYAEIASGSDDAEWEQLYERFTNAVEEKLKQCNDPENRP